jgi:hypothetical protein
LLLFGSFFVFLKHNMANNQHDGEMIGLHSPANGRSCVQHGCCGKYLMVGELQYPIANTFS